MLGGPKGEAVALHVAKGTLVPPFQERPGAGGQSTPPKDVRGPSTPHPVIVLWSA